MKRAGAIAAMCLWLTACGWVLPHKDDSSAPQQLSKLDKDKAPPPAKLAIQPSAEITPDPEKALENYRRLLELHPDSATAAEAGRRIADLQVQIEDAKGNTDNGAALRESIGIYTRLLAERPNDPGNDLVLHQLARAYDITGNPEQALATLQRLAHSYPSSPMAVDAHFRIGEILYSHDRFEEAVPEYQAVVAAGPQNPLFEPAQFKYGWCLYQLQRYADDIAAFFAVLDRNLPAGQPEDPEAAVKATPAEKQDAVKQSLHVVSLSFAALGGGAAVNDYFRQHGEPRFAVLVYRQIGDFMLEKRRYTDAAAAFAAFIQSHPADPHAPQFQMLVIGALRDGGFPDLVVAEKQRYAETYNPAAPYWKGATPTAQVMADLRIHLEDLARHYQARAQQDAPTDTAAKRADFATAAGWYRRILQFYPQDPKLADINLLYADALYDGEQTRDAAQEYYKTAYTYPGYAKAPEAAYASVQAYQRLAAQAAPADRAAALRASADAGVKLADSFPQHPQAATVLTRAAQDLYEIKDMPGAVAAASRVLKYAPPAPADLRAKALAVVADASFAQNKYADAEHADTQLLALDGSDPKQRQTVTEQLAASIYKQGEAARGAGDLRGAAHHFQRVAQVTPDASIRTKADYDAGSAYAAAQDWPAAEQSLEDFRRRYPDNALDADVDKQLALAYQKDKQPAQAAAVYQRIAQRSTESADTRRDSAWLAASLYEQAHQDALAAAAYDAYVRAYPLPLDRSLQARQRLAGYALARGDRAAYTMRLREIIAVDAAAGAGRSDATRLAAAQSALELGRIAAENARVVRIDLPIARTLPLRKQATEAAVQALNQAAAYGLAEQTTAATYELAGVYRDYSRALLESERPPQLGGEELKQYELLLEEQAEPFDELAIKAHEANLVRIKQGIWNPWVRKSADALAEMSPGKYGKREQREEIYDNLR
ncbi:MAG: tetratricopeptide repeat protein [Nevskia sp.]|nr:tetratricopeptide repeat protein [Nevskia sp.]